MFYDRQAGASDVSALNVDFTHMEDNRMILKGGYNLYDIPIGVISLESYFPKPPGHIKNPTTFDFPVIYKTVAGATVDRLIRERDPALLKPFIDAARSLEREGVRAITGSCGFLALYQQEITDAVEVPVFISSLIQIPLVQQMLGSRRKVGVVVANREALTVDHLNAVGVKGENLVIAGMENQPQFSSVILKGEGQDLDITIFEKELTDVVAYLLETHKDIGALVLECTDLSYFAPLLHKRFHLPVFDLTSLTRMVAATVNRKKA